MVFTETAEKAVTAYGGADVWMKARKIEAVVSASGLAFFLKRRPPFKTASLMLEVNRPAVSLTPIGNQKHPVTGILNGQDVTLTDGQGRILDSRTNARSAFPFGRRLFFWDDLDMTYFACYAFWNYLTLPRLLLREDILWEEKAPGHLTAGFPDHLPTHSKKQEFRFDPVTGLLLQHTYTAEVISNLAAAANCVVSHSEEKGIRFPSRRIVSPMKPNREALGYPVLIDMTIRQFRLIL
ncbi:MAG: hypothetical protein L6Q77_01855 [Bacteroidetes bacterium]|nr:hypothetical protein [Bacteroidota bacterium]